MNVLLVPAHPGFPGQIPQSRKTVVCVCDKCCVLCSCKKRQRLGKKYMEYEVEGARPRGRPFKKTWREIVEKDCQARGLNREDAMDHIKWKKQIRDD